MKFRNVFFVAIIVIMAACGKDALDVTFNANYKVDLPVAVTGAKAEYDFAVSDTIDPMMDEEVTKYMGKIKEWKLEGLEGEYKDLSEEFKLISGTLSVKSEGFLASWVLANIDIKEAYNMILTNSNGQFDEVNKILASKKPFIISFVGKTDKKDITYKVGMTVKTKVTANPL